MVKVGKLLIEGNTDGKWIESVETLMNLIHKKTKCSPVYWYAEGKKVGWTKKDVYNYMQACSGTSLLLNLLPGGDCNFRIYNFGKGIAINTFHHFSPTGDEWYYLVPIGERTFKLQNHKRLEIEGTERLILAFLTVVK